MKSFSHVAFEIILYIIVFCSFYDLNRTNAKQIIITSFQTNLNRENIVITFAKQPKSKRFGMNITLYKPIYENQFTVNVRLRVKPKGQPHFRNLYSWKGVEGCSFLEKFQEKKSYQSFFKLSPELLEVLRCPMKVGHYECKNLEVEQSAVVDFLVIGQYRIIADIMVNGTSKPFLTIMNLVVE